MSDDLHDSVVQLLTSASMQLAVYLQFPKADNFESVKVAHSHILEAVRLTRSLTFQLSPPVLYELGLGPAIESMGDHLTQLYGMPVNTSDVSQEVSPPEDLSVLLFRSVRELVINAMKHSQAKSVSVSSRMEDGDYVLTVEDDGIGFDADRCLHPRTSNTGMGLFSIDERLRAVGGCLRIDSVTSYGSRITVSVPLPADDEDQ